MPPGEPLALFSSAAHRYNGKFKNQRNQNIYCYYWKPVTTPRALLLISHGFTEHCMLYDNLANEMTRRGFFVFAHDHAGHGHSDGERGFITNLKELAEDSISHIKMVREEFPNIPLFICSHSMGCSVSVFASLKKEVDISGMVLIAPAFAANPETATYFRLAVTKIMSYIYPRFPVAFSDFTLSCQSKEYVEALNNDPLVYKGFWKVGLVVCLLESGDEVLRNSREVKEPVLILHGDADKVCHIKGATQFYEDISSEDKTLKVYPGAYHSLLNEPKGVADDVFHQTVQWLESRV